MIIILLWVICLWASFFMLLLSQPDSIISSSTKLPADLWQKLYYAGFTISTLGVGDYISSNNWWRILTDVYAFTGLVLITMSITYFVPVLSGVILQRNLGIFLCSLGQTPQQVVLNSWDGKSFHRLTTQVSSLSNMLIMHSQNHKAYPIIHYFHTRKARHAIIIRLTVLYEALLILQYFIKEEIRPSNNDLSSLVEAMENYLEVIEEVSSVKKEGAAPDAPKINELQKAGFVDTHKVSVPHEDNIQKNRIVLKNLLVQDGWSWQDIYEPTVKKKAGLKV
ncbi:potassium channel family protein [Telluribacter humicola]|uniref:potassium channel family protein n=1 Tax=Telluribacter humicola TaxID=1720261 RepID=UPI00286E2B8B|nr:potassium channel family protein [Telluribacter humicola]